MKVLTKWTREEWDQLYFGDLILTWLRAGDAPDLVTWLVCEAIELFTGGPSHVLFYVGDQAPNVVNPGYDHMFFEMTHPHGRWDRLDEEQIAARDLAVIRHRAFADFDVENALDACLKLTGVGYDYRELFDHLQELIWEDVIADSDPMKTVCSTAAETITDAAGFRYVPDVHPQLVSPADQFTSMFADVIFCFGNQAIKAWEERETLF